MSDDISMIDEEGEVLETAGNGFARMSAQRARITGSSRPPSSTSAVSDVPRAMTISAQFGAPPTGTWTMAEAPSLDEHAVSLSLCSEVRTYPVRLPFIGCCAGRGAASDRSGWPYSLDDPGCVELGVLVEFRQDLDNAEPLQLSAG